MPANQAVLVLTVVRNATSPRLGFASTSDARAGRLVAPYGNLSVILRNLTSLRSTRPAAGSSVSCRAPAWRLRRPNLPFTPCLGHARQIASPSDFRQPPPVGMVWLARLVALVAASIAGYLLWASLVGGAKLAGCGDDGGFGCESVLTSRWSSWCGMPVSLPAVIVYLTLLAALWASGPRPADTPSATPGGSSFHWPRWQPAPHRGFARAIVRAAQDVPYCLGLHACGIAPAAFVFWYILLAPLFYTKSRFDSHALMPPQLAVLLLMLGLVGVGVLIGGQMFSSPPEPHMQITHSDGPSAASRRGRYVAEGAPRSDLRPAGSGLDWDRRDRAPSQRRRPPLPIHRQTGRPASADQTDRRQSHDRCVRTAGPGIAGSRNNRGRTVRLYLRTLPPTAPLPRAGGSALRRPAGHCAAAQSDEHALQSVCARRPAGTQRGLPLRRIRAGGVARQARVVPGVSRVADGVERSAVGRGGQTGRSN